MHRLLLLVAASIALAVRPAATQDGTGRIGVALTIVEPVSTDRSGPPTVRRSGTGLDVALPAAAGVEPIVEVTMERGGRVAGCPSRPRAADYVARKGVHHAACPLSAATDGAPTRIRVVIVPVS